MKKIIGSKGEEIAENLLLSKGYKIIRKNFRFGRYGEVDIIAEIDELLVFVEVKLRTNMKYGKPEDQINQTKIQNFKRACQGYLYINNIKDKEIRIDFIGIDFSEDQARINHIENAF